MMGTQPRLAESWRAAYAVRRDWPDGTHEFVGIRARPDAAALFLSRDREFWRRGPWRPTYGVVEISGRDFDLHFARTECRAPDCPSRAEAPPPEGAPA